MLDSAGIMHRLGSYYICRRYQTQRNLKNEMKQNGADIDEGKKKHKRKIKRQSMDRLNQCYSNRIDLKNKNGNKNIKRKTEPNGIIKNSYILLKNKCIAIHSNNNINIHQQQKNHNEEIKKLIKQEIKSKK